MCGRILTQVSFEPHGTPSICNIDSAQTRVAGIWWRYWSLLQSYPNDASSFNCKGKLLSYPANHFVHVVSYPAIGFVPWESAASSMCCKLLSTEKGIAFIISSETELV